MRSSSLRGMDPQTEKYKYKYNIVDNNDCVIILTVFYVWWLKMCRRYRRYRLLLWYDVSFINVLINGMNKNEMKLNEISRSHGLHHHQGRQEWGRSKRYDWRLSATCLTCVIMKWLNMSLFLSSFHISLKILIALFGYIYQNFGFPSKPYIQTSTCNILVWEI
jgi:hypothetical protein